MLKTYMDALKLKCTEMKKLEDSEDKVKTLYMARLHLGKVFAVLFE